MGSKQSVPPVNYNGPQDLSIQRDGSVYYATYTYDGFVYKYIIKREGDYFRVIDCQISQFDANYDRKYMTYHNSLHDALSYIFKWFYPEYLVIFKLVGELDTKNCLYYNFHVGFGLKNDIHKIKRITT